MRYLITSLMLCCCFASGYAQEESPSEVTTTDDSGDGQDVAVGTESYNTEHGCGCGNKPKI